MADVFLVTGSSVGLGRAIVESALSNGQNVVATARNPAVLAELVAQHPEHLLALALDVTDANGARIVAEKAVARFGRIDVLINNAGFSGLGAIEDMPLALVEEQLSTNFMGAVNLARAVLPAMRAQGHGRILLVSSIGARIATAGAGIYYASKAAVSALAESLSLEVAPLGISVTAIEPGAMRTRFAEADSLKVSPFSPAYEATVGTTIAMMRDPAYLAILRDPKPVAEMILRVATLSDAPTRILAGADSFEMGTASGNARRSADQHWEALSRSATIDDGTALAAGR